MKTYPSIPKAMGCEGFLHTFDKIDGSNLRFEWTKKRGWFKFGTRKCLFDESDQVFGAAIHIFNDTLAKPLEKIIVAQSWQKVVVFAEFWAQKVLRAITDLTILNFSP